MAAVTGFFAHKNGVWQTGILPSPNPDAVITFSHVLFNIGEYYDPIMNRFTPPSGIYHMDLSINIANPIDGGKYYALVRKNGQPNIDGNPDAFELLRPNRMSGAADTVGTGVSGLVVANGTDYFEAVLQHSNVPPGTLCNIGGARFETYWCAHLIGDYVAPNPPPPPPTGGTEYTQGTPVGPIAAGSWTYADRSWTLNPGATVNKIGMYSAIPGTFPLKIVRRVSAGVYDVILSQNIVHAGTGWEDIDVASWAVPADGKDYHLAAYTTGQNMMMFDLLPRACANSNIAGNGVSMIEAGPLAGYYVIGVRATYL